MQRLLRDPTIPGAVEEGKCGGAGFGTRRLIQRAVDDDGSAIAPMPRLRPGPG